MSKYEVTVTRSVRRRDYECGCAWIEQRGNWWHVVACPDHVMDGLPKTEPFMVEQGGISREPGPDLPPRTCTCEPGQLDLTGHHHEACPALDDR